MHARATCLAAALLLLPPARAASAQAAPAEATWAQPAAEAPAETWHLDLATYAWLSATRGTIGAAGLRGKVDNSFGDTLDQSDSLLAFMAHGELRRGRLGLFLDGVYINLGYDDVRAGAATLDATSVLGIVEFGAAWEVAQGRLGTAPLALDLLGGGRWTRNRNKLFLVDVGGGSQTTDWVDPFAGLRLRGRIGERWEYTLRGDLGGGLGGSQVAWQAVATLGYRFRLFGMESTTLVGYRALYQDYESAKAVWDVTMHGPVIGLNLRF